MGTKIEWVKLLAENDGETWNPVTGCSKISEGCRFCYAERISLEHGLSSAPWTWENASQNILLHHDRLEKPLHWKQPRAVFVGSMTDLFHELVSFSFIDKIFEIILQANWHFYEILTKRPERLLEWLRQTEVVDLNNLPDNVGWGVTAEDQKNALHRLPLLAQLNSAALRYVSCEPLVGEVDLTQLPPEVIKKINWVIAGGESGYENARPLPTRWVRKLQQGCQQNEIPFLFKQWGEWLPADQIRDPSELALIKPYAPSTYLMIDNQPLHFYKVGRQRAGRMLDTTLWDELPKEISNAFRPVTKNPLQPSLFD